MRKLRYKLLPAVGPGSLEVEGSVLTLLFDIPYFITAKIVPPLHIINDVSRTGRLDAGMSGGCVWAAFELNESEYAEIAGLMKRHAFRSVETPGWVRTKRDWSTWTAELVWGIPALENKRHSDEIDRLSQERAEAEAGGDKARATELLVAISRKASEWNRFVEAHRAAKPRIPLLRKHPPDWVAPYIVIRHHKTRR